MFSFTFKQCLMSVNSSVMVELHAKLYAQFNHRKMRLKSANVLLMKQMQVKTIEDISV